MNPRFHSLVMAFHRMIGRSQMSLRYGHSRRAYVQTLAASRLMKWAMEKSL